MREQLRIDSLKRLSEVKSGASTQSEGNLALKFKLKQWLVPALICMSLLFVNRSPAYAPQRITPEINAPSAPRNLAAAAGTNSISLAWTPPSSNGGDSITGYKIYRGVSVGGEGLAPIDTVGNVTSIIDNSVGDGTTYFYVVKATNSAGDSSPSNEASAVVPVTGGLPIMPLAGSLFIIILMLALLVSRRRRVTPEDV